MSGRQRTVVLLLALFTIAARATRAHGENARADIAQAELARAEIVLADITHAEIAPGDSLLHEYVRSLSDSTDTWFGVSAAPVDTAGLDSALAAGLASNSSHGHAGAGRGRHGVNLDWTPALGFNRADGGQLGLGITIHSPLLSEFAGRAQYTTGTHDLLGEGSWRGSWRVALTRLSIRAVAGRWTEAFDRDHWDPWFTGISALFYGQDRHQYLRRDGFRSELRLGREAGFVSVGWRDQAESALPYTTRWTVFGKEPVLTFVTPTIAGRARELSLRTDFTLPRTRFRVNAAHWTSDPRLGSDFRYRRTRVTVGGDVSLGRHLAFVPQASFGRLRGDALPQEAFFMGGVYSLRTLPRNALAGTGMAFARTDLILVDDLRTLLHVPLPAWLPLQAHVFAASGALWGMDPATGFARPEPRNWPLRSEWRSEVGGGLSWRPGLPDPLAALRFEYAVPIGADARSAGFTIAFQRAVSLLPAR